MGRQGWLASSGSRALTDSSRSGRDINPCMEAFTEGASRAIFVVVVFLAFVGVCHALIVAASLSIWLYERWFDKGDD